MLPTKRRLSMARGAYWIIHQISCANRFDNLHRVSVPGFNTMILRIPMIPVEGMRYFGYLQQVGMVSAFNCPQKRFHDRRPDSSRSGDAVETHRRPLKFTIRPFQKNAFLSLTYGADGRNISRGASTARHLLRSFRGSLPGIADKNDYMRKAESLGSWQLPHTGYCCVTATLATGTTHQRRREVMERSVVEWHLDPLAQRSSYPSVINLTAGWEKKLYGLDILASMPIGRLLLISPEEDVGASSTSWGKRAR
ncbi:hypothetical protein CCUS01_16463 [Colletotrichum cuscutae]|uniref:Uncharacterized protein n=1 Tax=Colletotrichum cuscutae TaxID=1209917 RepID=A0AAI9VBY6_9PEZI|nr:hypothetical protein CCUS01_16463 [Colletotrichum cuscutae]